MHRYPVDSTEVLPAQAGVSPLDVICADARLGAPRASGGESLRLGSGAGATQCSPRKRG